MPTEIEILQRELAAARIEIESLQLRLSNATLLLKKEMTASGRLPNPEEMSHTTPAGIDYLTRFGISVKKS